MRPAELTETAGPGAADSVRYRVRSFGRWRGRRSQAALAPPDPRTGDAALGVAFLSPYAFLALQAALALYYALDPLSRRIELNSSAAAQGQATAALPREQAEPGEAGQADQS